MLTGDTGLRNAAETETIEVHGTLWLMEKMYNEGIIHYKRAEQAYAEMQRERRYLPWKEVNKQLNNWKNN